MNPLSQKYPHLNIDSFVEKVALTFSVPEHLGILCSGWLYFDVPDHFQGHPFMGISRGGLDSIPVKHPTVINASCNITYMAWWVIPVCCLLLYNLWIVPIIKNHGNSFIGQRISCVAPWNSLPCPYNYLLLRVCINTLQCKIRSVKKTIFFS